MHFGGAVAVIALAVSLRWLLDPWLGGHLPLAALYGAVALAVWLGGYRPAVVVVLLSYAACDWLFIEPRGTFGFDSPRRWIGLLTHLLSCASIVGLGQALRTARRSAEASRDFLGQEVAHYRQLEQRFRLAAAVNGIIYEYDFLTGQGERTGGCTKSSATTPTRCRRRKGGRQSKSTPTIGIG